ncbi:MAG: hypothetical protein Q4G68_10685 [Planctomycetia bacterium]|nr:hypothetical protein [Planctomycetia bacterium]
MVRKLLLIVLTALLFAISTLATEDTVPVDRRGTVVSPCNSSCAPSVLSRTDRYACEMENPARDSVVESPCSAEIPLRVRVEQENQLSRNLVNFTAGNPPLAATCFAKGRLSCGHVTHAGYSLSGLNITHIPLFLRLLTLRN